MYIFLRKEMKKVTTLILGLVLLVGITVYILGDVQKKDLKDAIASAVNSEPSKILLNLPPNPVRAPGTILSPRSSSFLIYTPGSMADENLLKGESFSINAVLDDMSQIYGATKNSFLTTAFSSNSHLEVTLNITDAYIAELPIKELKLRAIDNELVNEAIRKGNDPIIVSRSYVGKVEYVIQASDDIGVQALIEMSKKGFEIAKNKLGSFEFSDRLESKKEIGFSITQPIVFAYEVLSVSFVVTDLSDGAEVGLTEISARRVKELGNENKVSSKNTLTKWGAVSISNAHYPNFSDLNVPQAERAGSLMADFLESYNPEFTKRIISTKVNPLTDESLLDWSVDFTMEMLENPVEHLVVYYTGHGLSLPNGEVVLLQGNINKDYAERAAKNGTPELSELGDGILLVEQLYNALEMAGVPFTLIIDACYPNDEMAEALTRVSMLMSDKSGTELLYNGDEFLITNELSDIGRVMRIIGSRFEYRTKDNAVIFSSKPGAKSVFKVNPIDPYDLDLPPLAAGILQYSHFASSESSKLGLGTIIRRNIDSANGLGEVSLNGSITWSNLEPMLKAFESK
jgi:hypothetical protein